MVLDRVNGVIGSVEVSDVVVGVSDMEMCLNFTNGSLEVFR